MALDNLKTSEATPFHRRALFSSIRVMYCFIPTRIPPHMGSRSAVGLSILFVMPGPRLRQAHKGSTSEPLAVRRNFHMTTLPGRQTEVT